MRLVLERCTVRSWQTADVPSLARRANDRSVWLNLRDAFPHPYTEAHARAYIDRARAADPETTFAIEIAGEAAGGIGFHLREDVERVSAEIGYWVAAGHRRRGIATEAIRAVTAHAVAAHGLTRVFAVPFEWNTASCRALEKAGYALEARMRRSAIKDGRVVDQFLYAFVVNVAPGV